MAASKTGYYQIERLLGEGGMGAVYEAVHRMTGKRVAVKMLRAELANRFDLQARFFNEARTTSFLDHRGIVRVFDVARTDDGAAYMVMELCHGPTLQQAFVLERKLQVRLGLIGAVAEALAYAHEKGIVHRDLKPDNVIITGGPNGPQPKVLDFGIAKLLEGAEADVAFNVKTRTGSALGTPLYMSPEQCRGTGGITTASDVYALGVMLFECVLGRVPFNGGVGEVILQHLTSPAPRLTEDTVVDVEPGLDPLCSAMLDKNPLNRPTMADVAEALERYAPRRAEFVLPALPPVIQAAVHAPAPLGVDTGADTIAPRLSAADTAPNTAPPVEVPVRRPRAASMAPLLVGICVAIVAVGAAILHRATQVSPSIIREATPVAANPTQTGNQTTTVTPTASPLPWTIDSVPDGADVFLADGTLVGRTPYIADALLARGERTVYVRRNGFRDEIVRYDASGKSVVTLRPKLVVRPHPLPKSPKTNHDDFNVEPLR